MQHLAYECALFMRGAFPGSPDITRWEITPELYTRLLDIIRHEGLKTMSEEIDRITGFVSMYWACSACGAQFYNRAPLTRQNANTGCCPKCKAHNTLEYITEREYNQGAK